MFCQLSRKRFGDDFFDPRPMKMPRFTSEPPIHLMYPKSSHHTFLPKEANDTPIPSLSILPNELLHEIVSLLPLDVLSALTKVCVSFREMVTPYYFHVTSFHPDPFWTDVDQSTCEALLLWRRIDAYKAPENLYCNFSSEGSDSHLRALIAFFQSSKQTHGSFSLYLGRREFSPELLDSLLESLPRILPKGHTTIGGYDQFTVLDSAIANVLHSPRHPNYFVNFVQHLAQCSWTTLLNVLTLPTLRYLEVEDRCPLLTLGNFLNCHYALQSLAICAAYDTRHKGSLAFQGTIYLPNLTSLRGSIAYISALTKRLANPQTIKSMSLSMNKISRGCYFLSKVLSCTKMCSSMEALNIRFDTLQPIPEASLSFPVGEKCTCVAECLQLSCFCSSGTVEGVDILTTCSNWLATFPNVMQLTLQPSYRTDTNTEEVRDAFLCATTCHG
ncbi:hypothetical protein JVT61DRAFT_12426 [Boletus reticuloceps]|uniref:F-box domain-containing protein n=1 Tax=Boletus reticuloceps TaxID=495285 RepID=A0A8I3A3I7_9AGAM|nr:hypothetical protein JVT61DRAFT_12426 [Boletus reticuloceps]